jgi:transposase
MTIQLEFTPDILQEIHDHRYTHPAPLVQRRMEALWLKGHGLPHGQIAELVGVTENTIRDYFELYQQGGVEKLKELNYHFPESKLNAHITSLEAHFRDNPPASIKEAQSEIEAITGVKRSETQVAEFLKKNYISVAEKSA